MRLSRLAVVAALGLAPAPLLAQQGLDSVTIRVEKLADNVYVLFGSGGNIGLSVGDDGAFLIDDQFAPLTPKIKAAVATVTNKPIRFVFNTHWHGDHTGGNENLGNGGAVIVAHDNARLRMSTEQFNKMFNNRTPPSPKAALPVVTFADAVTFHLNGDEISGTHVAPAHTDGDAYIYFKKANVLHTGDTFMNGNYPFIDVASGGTVNGIVAAADRYLALVRPDTKIIPGHGPMATVADLREYRNVVATVRDRIQKLITSGASLDQVKAAKPTAEFDAKFGKGFINAERFVEIVYSSLTMK